METVLGIDLGTTYSAVSTLNEYGKPVILRNAMNENLTPSVLFFDADGTILIGQEAKDRQALGDENIALFFKRYLGNPDYVLSMHGKTYTPTDLSALLLKKLKDDAAYRLGCLADKAVITVPAYFNDLQRNETLSAARQAGLDVLRIINEPTAAALYYGLNASEAKNVLVYDLGGGTFDVTVIRLSDEELTVLATGGHHELGGKDWDDSLVRYLTDRFYEDTGEDIHQDVEAYMDLQLAAENAKKKLSILESVSVTVRYKGERERYEITRAYFEDLTLSLMNSTTFKAEEILAEAGLDWAVLDGVLLVGGSTKMPMVYNWVKKMSGKEPLRGINVDEAVCLGAALQAGLDINEKKKTQGQAPLFRLPGLNRRLTDVMSHSLGTISVKFDNSGYKNSIIVPKNIPVPSNEEKPYHFYTYKNKPNHLDLYLTQGETEDVAQTQIVALYAIDNISYVPGGQSVLYINYAYDKNGTIHIHVRQKETGRVLEPVKKPLPADMSWVYGVPPAPQRQITYIYMAIDTSYSMAGEGISCTVKGIKQFIKELDLANCEIAFAACAQSVRRLIEGENNINKLNKYADYFKECVYRSLVGAGSSGQPFDDAYAYFRTKKEGRKVMIVFADGLWSNQDIAIRKATSLARELEVEICSIGVPRADEKFLRKLATTNQQSIIASFNEMETVFGSIARELN